MIPELKYVPVSTCGGGRTLLLGVVPDSYYLPVSDGHQGFRNSLTLVSSRIHLVFTVATKWHL